MRLRRSLERLLQGREEENVATSRLGLQLLVRKALLTRRGPLARLIRRRNSHRAQNGYRHEALSAFVACDINSHRATRQNNQFQMHHEQKLEYSPGQ